EVNGIGNVSYQFSYTYSKSEDTTSGFRSNNAQVPFFDHKHFKSVSDYDLTNYISISGVWGLPGPKNWGGAPRLLLSGWTLEPIVSHRSGLPLDVLARITRPIAATGPSAAGDGELVRANQVAPITYFDPHKSQSLHGSKPGNYFFDPSAFSTAAL